MEADSKPAGIPAAAYARCSTDRQAVDGLSITAQLEEIHRYAASGGYEIVLEFIDEGRRGKDETRDEFCRLKDLAKSRNCPFRAVIVWKSDRIARDLIGAQVFRRDLNRRSIELLSVAEPNLSGPVGDYLKATLDASNQFYSAQLAENTLRGSKQGARMGYAQGGTAPYGYRKVQVENERGGIKWKFQPDPIQAAVVRRIYEAYAGGMSLGDLTKALNNDGVPSQTGRKWQSTAVWNVLFKHQATYLGCVVYNRTRQTRDEQNKVYRTKKDRDEWVVTPGAHEAIISQSLADSVTIVRDGRAPHLNPNRNKANSPQLLAGLVYCGVCGSRCGVGYGGRYSGGRMSYYRCIDGAIARLKGEPQEHPHRAPWIRSDRLEAAVRAAVYPKIRDPEFLRTLNSDIEEGETSFDGGLDRRVSELRLERTRLEKRRGILTETILDGTIPREVGRRKMEELTKTISLLEAQERELSEPRREDPLIGRLRSLTQADLDAALEDDDALRAVLTLVIDEITITPNNGEKARIAYSFIFDPETVILPCQNR